MTYSDFRFRQLHRNEVENLVQMTDEVGWGFSAENWRIILSSGQIFLLVDEANEIAATAALFRYRDHLASIGSVIVRQRFRGLGLASRVLDAAEDSLDLNRSIVQLIATRDGFPVYQSRGYRRIADCHRLVRPNGSTQVSVPSLPGCRFDPVSPDLWEGVLDFDRKCNQVDRGQVLTAMFHAGYRTMAVFDQKTRQILGYAMAGPRKSMTVIGPVVAIDPSIACALVQMLIYGRSEDFRIDILSHQEAFCAGMEREGFCLEGTSPVMVRGKGPLKNLQSEAYAIISQAFG
ncbi:GNAT family N-acetyltransferase [Sneathiella aquimaris]|uniref:GNAT family N-acetyltransferase n=1 Tax=Sneathiella aquimaris TaxID=2599305 RepID=UPI00146C5D54|nr:GNAT family N-acetyltransferase [Sneathiella aquimaris]